MTDTGPAYVKGGGEGSMRLFSLKFIYSKDSRDILRTKYELAWQTIIVPFNDSGGNSPVQVTDLALLLHSITALTRFMTQFLSVIGPRFHALRGGVAVAALDKIGAIRLNLSCSEIRKFYRPSFRKLSADKMN